MEKQICFTGHYFFFSIDSIFHPDYESTKMLRHSYLVWKFWTFEVRNSLEEFTADWQEWISTALLLLKSVTLALLFTKKKYFQWDLDDLKNRSTNRKYHSGCWAKPQRAWATGTKKVISVSKSAVPIYSTIDD